MTIVVRAVVLGILGTAAIVGAPPTRTAAGHLGFTVGQYGLLGAFELAGAVGLLGGLAGDG